MTKANSIDSYIPTQIDILEQELNEKDDIITKKSSKINVFKAIVRKKNSIIEYKDELLLANETTIEALRKQLQESSAIIEKLIENSNDD